LFESIFPRPRLLVMLALSNHIDFSLFSSRVPDR
jgi:hypothetical protein